jgi:Protein of unknown function (DUF2877)
MASDLDQGAFETLTMGSIVTMNVIAASAGLQSFLHAASWEGWITAVFASSLLCTTPFERLVHLHAGAQLVSPFSLRVEAEFARAIDKIPLVQGMPVRKMGSGIDIADNLHFRLDDIPYYQSPRHFAGELHPEAVEIARQTLRSHGRPGGFDRLPGAQTIVTAMQQALVNAHAGQLLEVARRLIGLGPGLTPSGDDLMVGCLRGLWLMPRNEPAVLQMLDGLRTGLLPDLDERTTCVGAEFIRYAMDGAFAEVLDRAAEALSAPISPQLVHSAIGRLLAQGETSGTDTTLGLLTCLEAMFSNSHDAARGLREAVSSAPWTSTAP